ncbi:UNVERIFIED_CONTAM: SPX domain-containing protein 2 [Sesamum radiatum]|uniref:SPX domain-containing protein 2 n=1 Tax=Sesamum radiatum TaxID=300843 RepID=A0AAW2L0A1_SESRA
MKFWKILSRLLDEMFPDWQDKFISYKHLKKQLNLILPLSEPSENLVHDGSNKPDKRERESDDGADGRDKGKEVMVRAMDDFVKLLKVEINKFNGFFMDQEEDYIIRLKFLKDEVAEAKDSREELMEVGRKLVDFHGEMILLQNYSLLNYIGLHKILKKYDKRSGDLIRLPFIQKVLHEPFFRTEVIKKLVKECEIMISCIFSRNTRSVPPEDTDLKEGCHEQEQQPVVVEEMEKHLTVPKELEEIECMENMYLKLSISALRSLKQIRNGSSTASMFALAPMPGTRLHPSLLRWHRQTLRPSNSHPSAEWSNISCKYNSKDLIIHPSKPITARVFLPTDATTTSDSLSQLPLLVYFHGGGFCIGSTTWLGYHVFLGNLSATAKTIVFSVDYRLAPENKLPIAYEDCYSALEWLSSSSEPWLRQADLSSVFLSGDSAGGNIAHQVAIKAIKANILNIRIKGLVPIHPFFGSETRTELELADSSADAVAMNDMFWKLSLPDGCDRDFYGAILTRPGRRSGACFRQLWC